MYCCTFVCMQRLSSFQLWPVNESGVLPSWSLIISGTAAPRQEMQLRDVIQVRAAQVRCSVKANKMKVGNFLGFPTYPVVNAPLTNGACQLVTKSNLHASEVCLPLQHIFHR